MRYHVQTSRVIESAADRARDCGHSYVGSAHLLLALAMLPGDAGLLLRSAGLDLPLTEAMTRRGADYFILGCTELPLAADAAGLHVPAVDPTEELAKAAIRWCGYSVKGE